jgi:hypothetical protein
LLARVRSQLAHAAPLLAASPPLTHITDPA